MRRLATVLAVTGTITLSTAGGGTACASVPPSPPPLTVQVEDSPDLGRVMADLNGHTLYRYDLDTTTKIACTGNCTDTRKPFPYHNGDVLQLPPGIAGTLGHVLRPDGTAQITYDNMPLYTYTADQFPGDATGNGGHWHAIRPADAPGH